MKNIAIYGAGGFGKEVFYLIKATNKINKEWNFIGFFDDDLSKKNTSILDYQVIGGIEDLNKYNIPLSIVFSIGSPLVIKKIVNKISNDYISFPNLLSPDCIFLDDESVSFGKGNVIMFQSLISCNVKFGDFNLLNCGISVGHDTQIGSFNSFMSYAKISGEVIIGNSNYFGACSLVLQQKSIGDETVLGANSVIMRNTEDGNTYLGNPAIKILKPNINKKE